MLACALPLFRLSETGKAIEAMKIESIFAAVLFVGGANLIARVLSQGVEPALAGTVIDWSASRIRTAIKRLRSQL